jgi:hypothetical protein
MVHPSFSGYDKFDNERGGKTHANDSDAKELDAAVEAITKHYFWKNGYLYTHFLYKIDRYRKKPNESK